MNIEEKYERMLKLKNKPYLEDSEYAELETLESEFEELNKDRRIPEPKADSHLSPSKKSKVLSITKRIFFGKPHKDATLDEIRQLELELRKARLNKAIKITKQTTPTKADKVFKALGVMAREINKEVVNPPRKKPISNKPKEDYWSKDKWNIKL